MPVPAVNDASGTPFLDPRFVRNAADVFEQRGSNVWFGLAAGELWAGLQPAEWTGPGSVAKSDGTQDVWIDSGSSSRAVIARRPEIRGAGHPFQCDMYLEGSDQHRGWFQSSLLLSLAGNGAAPYRTVLTHGFMVDADREKISKSQQGQGGYEKPQTAEAYVKKWGADIIRLWVASQDFRNDIIVSEERIQTVAETYRVLRNAPRYELANLADFDPAAQAVPDGQLTGLDCWILDEFSQLERDVLAAYDRHEFHVVYQRVSQFVAVERGGFLRVEKQAQHHVAQRERNQQVEQQAGGQQPGGRCGQSSHAGHPQGDGDSKKSPARHHRHHRQESQRLAHRSALLLAAAPALDQFGKQVAQDDRNQADGGEVIQDFDNHSVSYTHLTLPTIYSV